MKFIVTVRLPKNPKHDPDNKIVGECPVQAGKLCTDVTGQHHSFIFDTPNGVMRVESVMALLGKHYHVTRVEAI